MPHELLHGCFLLEVFQVKKDIELQIQLILGFIGDQIDSEIRMSLDDMNELWQWLSDLL